ALCRPASCPVDEDTAHGLGRRGEEMAAVVPLVASGRADQTEVRFMDEGCRLKCVPGWLGSQAGRGEAAKFVVDQGQQLRGGPRVTLVDRLEELRNLDHGIPQA